MLPNRAWAGRLWSPAEANGRGGDVRIPWASPWEGFGRTNGVPANPDWKADATWLKKPP